MSNLDKALNTILSNPAGYKTLQQVGRYDLILIAYINESGYAGIMPDGHLVDRRIYPQAIPIQENSLMGIPKPKEL